MMRSGHVAVVGLILLGVSTILRALTESRVVGYYTMWGTSTLPASAVKFENLTHVFHAFAWPTASGAITSNPVTVDAGLIFQTHRAGRKILISLGGASASTNFSTVAADTAKRRTFINNLVTYVVNNHYDGADFDWEGPSTAADSINDIALMRETRSAFRAADSTLLLTMAIGASSYGGRYRNYDSLNKYVDWFNVMTYDLDQGWSGKSGYNAALFYYPAMGSDYSVDQSITYLRISRSIPASKLVLGVPFYGKRFNGTATFNKTFTAPLTWPLYSDVVALMQSGLWTRYWDNTAKVPYLSNGSSVITYDDSLSIALKCQYAKQKGLGGVMIWELSQDVVGQTQPLLDVVAAQILLSTFAEHEPAVQRVELSLADNYPNPFNPSTTIEFSLPREGHVSLRIYDLLGREIATLVDEWRNAGTGSVQFDAGTLALASGMYVYRLSSGTAVLTKKLIYQK
jgi:chitinase